MQFGAELKDEAFQPKVVRATNNRNGAKGMGDQNQTQSGVWCNRAEMSDADTVPTESHAISRKQNRIIIRIVARPNDCFSIGDDLIAE
jgi:hypothetical protein